MMIYEIRFNEIFGLQFLEYHLILLYLLKRKRLLIARNLVLLILTSKNLLK